MLSGEGIIMSSQSFTLGPTYNVPTNGNISNTWHISNGIPSLKNLYVWFLDNSYLKRSYCRKHFRLSLNVTEL